MDNLTNLANELSAVKIPKSVISVNFYAGRIEVHLKQKDFRSMFNDFETRPHGDSRSRLYLSAKVGGVEFFALGKVEEDVEA